MPVVTGIFEVSRAPGDLSEAATAAGMGRFVLSKRFHGELEAGSAGEMLSIGSPTAQGSAGYVAIERVEGKLAGRQGGFALQHFGIMERGAGRLNVEVVPDSGTGELQGLRGTMAIVVADGQHRYEFTYTLDAQAA